MKTLRSAAMMLISLTLITGVIYPLAVTLIAQIVFARQANGSLIVIDQQIVGSSLIGQPMDEARYFWSRPTAVSDHAGELTASRSSNAGSTNAALAEAVAARDSAFRAAHRLPENVDVPAEMLFASASGLDPHISPEAARLQIDRVAAARGIDRQRIAQVVEQHVESPQLGFLGQARVNVLLLNLALDGLQ